MDLELDEDLQANFLGTKDYGTVEGQSEFEQWVRINAIDRLYGITTTYKNEDIPHKIELSLRRLASDSDLIESVPNIDVKSVPSGYKVDAAFNEADNIEFLLEGL
jgi:hypothetical protein